VLLCRDANLARSERYARESTFQGRGHAQAIKIQKGDVEQIGCVSADVSLDSGLPAVAPVATHITPLSSKSSGIGAGQYRSSRRPRPSSLQAASGAVEAIFVEALVACWRLSRSAAASHTLEYSGRVPQTSLPTGAACSSSSVRARP
jgi:hypothetical protein